MRSMKRYQSIFYYTANILILGGIFLLSPLAALPAWPAETKFAYGFIIPALGLFFMGAVFRWIFKPTSPIVLNVREGGIIVVINWTAICIFSALPFMFILKFTFTQAIFEAVSGWTTTGLTVVDVLKTPHVLLLWRSIMQYLGGAGLAIIMMATITGPAGVGLPAAEGRDDQLVPNVRSSAKRVLTLYVGYAALGMFLYRLAGMSNFDAVNHSFTAVATGGFSTHPESIAFWNSAFIEAITIVLMILGNLNFLTAYLLFKRKFKAVYRNGEIRVLVAAAVLGSVVLFLGVTSAVYPSLQKSLRTAIFEGISALTGTGFTSTVYARWNALGFFTLVILMVLGGGTCSTSGGLKQYRVYMIFKMIVWEIQRPFLPRAAVIQHYVWRGESRDYIDDSRLKHLASYVFFYIGVLVVGTLILSAYGYTLQDSLFEFASALGTVGLSAGITTLHAPALLLWTETLGMFLGRLEFFVVFIGLGKIVREVFYLLEKNK